MDELTSPGGSVALAVSALLLVVGYRLARPERAREWLAVGAYGLALAAQLLGARGVLPGGTLVAGPALRIGGAVLLAAGLLLVGKPARARRRAAVAATGTASSPRAGTIPVGLAVVLAGQLARAPSLAGGIATLAAVLVCVGVAAKGRRKGDDPTRAPRG